MEGTNRYMRYLYFVSIASLAYTMASDTPKILNLEDISTPLRVPLSGKYKRSLAHGVIKDRMPVILTKIVDHFCQNKSQIIQEYGQDAKKDIKHIIGFLSQLKNEVTTNKTLKFMHLNNETVNDAEEWNKYLEHRTNIEGEIPTWFNTIWLYCESYMYRVLAQEIGLTNTLHNYDPFEHHKQTIFINSIDSVDALASYVRNILSNKEYNEESSKSNLSKLLKLSLWSNRLDLSMSAGSPLKQIGNPFDIVESLNENILANDWEFVWHIVKKKTEEDVDNIHIVLDNAGYELFTDMCLAAFIVTIVPTTKVTFHVKLYPWYLSDTMTRDFHWLLEYMNNLDQYPNIKLLSKTFEDFVDRGVWCIKEEPYWTGPYDFTQMKEKETQIYTQFSIAKLVIFKGDLNYRKLLGDINYEYTTSFATALGNFRPTNIVSLRTVKADICVGLPLGKAESLFEIDKKWMENGEYGVIQAASGLETSKPPDLILKQD